MLALQTTSIGIAFSKDVQATLKKVFDEMSKPKVSEQSRAASNEPSKLGPKLFGNPAEVLRLAE